MSIQFSPTIVKYENPVHYPDMLLKEQQDII